MEYPNFYSVNKFSLSGRYFCFFDVKDYLADALFVRHKVRVRLKKEYCRQGTDYVAILCKVPKKDVGAFVQALEELKGKMLLLGYTGYQNLCDEIGKKMEAVYHQEI